MNNVSVRVKSAAEQNGFGDLNMFDCLAEKAREQNVFLT